MLLQISHLIICFLGGGHQRDRAKKWWALIGLSASNGEVSDGPAAQMMACKWLDHGCRFMEPSIRAAFSPTNIIKTMHYFAERGKKEKICTWDSE